MDDATSLANENQDDSDKHSSENFQKYIFELLEKNGVINDLRAYLRGHIINVLKTAESCETLVCKKNFTQRLELTYQAINILIAEYLLRSEFSYSLSVFISEIPLANMVFSFARMLMETNDHSELRFKDQDVFSILKYIGIKCNSDHATLILDMYENSEKTPLLMCILKSLPLFVDKDLDKNVIVTSSQDNSISTKSSEEYLQGKCSHHIVCNTCRNRIAKIKEKYERKKKSYASSVNERINSLNMNMFLKNISVMEKGLIDELFQQLKSVYEAEMEMIKQDEEKRVQRSLAVYMLKLREKKEQLESSYKAREAELELSLKEKKRFLWGLARTLREQHQHMAKAMANIKAESERLASKEDSLRVQIEEAENILRRRGTEMRKQITSELSILENHLETMKKERESINQERVLLQNLKMPNTNIKLLSDTDELRSHYELLRDELNNLKGYVQSAKLDPKCVNERSTMTELSGVIDKFEVVLNNGQEIDLKSDKPTRLINDLKNPKNVNFEPISINVQANVGLDLEEVTPGQSSSSSEAGYPANVESEYAVLQEENRRLREFAKEQNERIDALSWQQAKLQAQISSHRTPVVTTSTDSRPAIPQNDSFTQHDSRTPQHASFAPQHKEVTPQNPVFNPQNPAFNPQNPVFNPQNPVFNPQNHVFNPQLAPITSQSINIVAQTSTFVPQTTHFVHNRNIPNPFIFQSGSLAPQNPLPQSNLVPQSTLGSQLLPTQPQLVVNQDVALPRPRTAPMNERMGALGQRLNPTVSVNNLSVGWRVGAGEEISMFSNPGPRVVLPGESIPFVGVVGTKHADNRRYLINQWRSLRRRVSPLNGVLKKTISPTNRDRKSNRLQNSITSMVWPNVQPSCSRNNNTGQIESAFQENNTKEEGSLKLDPLTVLKEAKEKLKNKDEIKVPSSTRREKSPNSVLREAKQRLKKLEIEAEAVEQSYLDFRKKKESKLEEFKDTKGKKPVNERNKSTSILNKMHPKETCQPQSTYEADKYILEFNTKLDLSKYNSKITTANKISPIPKEYTEKNPIKNYLETPLPEFRKYYNSGKRHEKEVTKLFEKKDDFKISTKRDSLNSPRKETTDFFKPPKSPLFKRNESPKKSIKRLDSPKSPKGTKKKNSRQDKNDEFKILKQNIGKIYNMELSDTSSLEISKRTNEIDDKENCTIEKPEIAEEKQGEHINNELECIKPDIVEDNSQVPVEDKNLLRIDVESNAQANKVNIDSNNENLMMLVESSVNDMSTIESSNDDNISTQMTIIVGPKRSPDNKAEIPMSTDLTSENVIQPIVDFNISKSDQIEDADYFDDFSADVDNYNISSEYGNGIQSPISLGKTSDNDFWDT